MVDIRRFRIGDEPALFRVFHSAVHLVARHHYTQTQLDAWAPADFDADEWAQRMRSINPFVAEIAGDAVGYADVQPSGYIDHFFVSGSRPRQGIGAALMQRLHEEAAALGITELTSDVSLSAQPFFARCGFEVVEHRTATPDGIPLAIARMRKTP